jgi:hypothetical protein
MIRVINFGQQKQLNGNLPKKKQLADRNVPMEGRKFPSRGVFVVLTIPFNKIWFPNAGIGIREPIIE